MTGGWTSTVGPMRWRYELCTSLEGALPVTRYVVAETRAEAQKLADADGREYAERGGPGVIASISHVRED